MEKLAGVFIGFIFGMFLCKAILTSNYKEFVSSQTICTVTVEGKTSYLVDQKISKEGEAFYVEVNDKKFLISNKRLIEVGGKTEGTINCTCN